MGFARASARRAARTRASALLVALVAFGATSCQLNTLFASTFKTVLGSDNGQPLSALSTLDQSGTANDWGRYIAFYPASTGYQGVFTFQLPSGIDRSTIGTLYVGANYRGQP